MVSIFAVSVAWIVYIRRRGISLELRDRFPALHRFLEHKWYFDELYDAVFVRPAATAGSFGRRVVETDFVQGFIVGGATGIVRVGTSFARTIQTGFLRGYALLLLLGLAALALYFLIVSS
jgi:NADH-quinone oxidoreductase subunit L